MEEMRSKWPSLQRAGLRRYPLLVLPAPRVQNAPKTSAPLAGAYGRSMAFLPQKSAFGGFFSPAGHAAGGPAGRTRVHAAPTKAPAPGLCFGSGGAVGGAFERGAFLLLQSPALMHGESVEYTYALSQPFARRACARFGPL